MAQKIRFFLLIAMMIVYCISFFSMIAPMPGMPFYIKAITLIGPVFVFFGLLLRQYKRMR
ncbi:MAG TPA: hypothetical protein GX726_04140 [Clostridiales bacterium]|nr:hypothetical protein [Clostridiales bacterium]